MSSNASPSRTPSGISATEMMNRMYRRQRHIYDLTRRYYLLGRDGLIDDLKPARGDGVLEIGCGTGRNLIRAARQYPDAQFYGIDVSTEMLTTAIREIEAAGLSSRISVAHADAASLDLSVQFGRRSFERVFFSYTLSMVPPWRFALENAVTRVAPGGELHIVDFGRMEALPRIFRAALLRWLAAFDVTPRDGLETHLSAYARTINASVTFRHRFRGYAQQAILRVSQQAR